MLAAPEPGRSGGWAESIRQAPIGVLTLGGVLFFAGALSVVGGLYLALARHENGWFAWVTALILGPVTMYVGLHMIRRTRWAWLTMVLLLLLLLGSSVVRAIGSPPFPVAPVAEIVMEAGCLIYLLRPNVRKAFGRA